MKKYIGLLLILFLMPESCTEKYNPDIESMPKVLVVDGLITNEYKQHVIYLSEAISYDSLASAPESGATVFVKDSHGTKTFFYEKDPGAYYSSLLNFTIGETYTLQVVTKDKKSFQSTEQVLLPESNMGSLSNSKQSIEMYHYVNQDLKLTTVNGAEFIAHLNLSSENLPYFRFANTILVEYTSVKDNELILKYCWNKYNPNSYFNINDGEYNLSEEILHDLGFFPFDIIFYGVVQDVEYPEVGPPIPIYTNKYLKNYIFTIKQYHLNKDIFQYYQSLNKQLQANDRFFDPISAQVIGNMKCTDNPDEKVFGSFEASTVSVNSYKLNLTSSGNSYEIIKINPFDMDTITNSGENPYTPPKFWIN